MTDEVKSAVEDVLPPVVDQAEPQPAQPELVKADTVNIEGGAQRVEARVVNVKQGGIGALKGEVLTVSVEQGGIGACAARRADVNIGANSGIGAIAAQEVALTNGNVSVLAALRVSGNPKVMFDLRAGLLAGLVAGAIFAVVDVVAKQLMCRKQS